MVPFIVLAIATTTSFLIQAARSRQPARRALPGALAHGMAAMFLTASAGHFIEPLRSGLEAIVPAAIPLPAFVVAASGVFEIVLAAAILWNRTRRPTAVVAILYLTAIFPANVLAASGVDHPAAPDTPIVLRTIIQLVFLAASAHIALRSPRLRQISAR